MYAIVQVGSRQFKVEKGDQIRVDRLESEVGDKLDLEKVLLVDSGKSVDVGKPYVKGAKVKAEVLRHEQGPKGTTLKYRSTKDSATKTGFRHQLTALSIEDISA